MIPRKRKSNAEFVKEEKDTILKELVNDAASFELAAEYLALAHTFINQKGLNIEYEAWLNETIAEFKKLT
jgi:hypothetical protein